MTDPIGRSLHELTFAFKRTSEKGEEEKEGKRARGREIR